MKQLLTTIIFAAATLTATAQVPAFPGAEGHGRYTTGGRGGKVIHVTNLNDSGTGSFRAAVSGSDKKTVVFDVGGVIALKSNLNIGANTTILGQTAPAPGITLRYYTVNPAGNNIIMRYIRIRRGEEKDVNDGADASTARHYTGMIIDHCSFSWSIDEVASFYDNNNFSMQWCTLGECLNNAGHNKGAHGYGGIWGGKLASFHHNLICHVNNRSPRFCGARYDWTGYTSNQLYSQYKWENAVQSENVDFRNCVVYNCGNGCYGGPGGGKINMVNNYYKTGPAATTSRFTTVTVGAAGNSENDSIYWDMTSRYYISGNYMYNNSSVTSNNWSGVTYDAYNSGAGDAKKANAGVFTIDGEQWSLDPTHYNGENETYKKNSDGKDCIRIRLDEPTAKGEVTTHTAQQAFNKVLTYAGASLTPDDVDKRYFTEAKNGTATYKGSVTGKAGRIDKVSDVNGYTEANFGTGSREAGFDADQDGMADAWEQANGGNLDPNAYTLDPKKMYTNIEVYANALVQDITLSGNADATDAVKEYYPAYKKADGTPVEAINTDSGSGEQQGGGTELEAEAEGAITWIMGDGSDKPAASYSDDIVRYIDNSSVNVGSHLKVNGTLKAGDYTMTAFTINDQQSDNGATDANAITFSITPAEGYMFQPTGVSFFATRFGTDHGKFQAYWISPDGSTAIIVPDQDAARNNATPPYSAINESVTGVSAASGTSSLTINLYDIPYNTNTKNMGLAYVVISGKVGKTVTDGIITTNKAAHEGRPRLYNIAGQRVSDSYHGIVIENGHKRTAK